MNDYIPEITFEEAKKLAEDAAKEQLNSLLKDSNLPLLSKHFVEGECCWFFFKNNQINVPAGSLRGWAYAVSKRGYVVLIADYSNDPVLLNEYLQKFSNHLKERGL